MYCPANASGYSACHNLATSEEGEMLYQPACKAITVNGWESKVVENDV